MLQQETIYKLKTMRLSGFTEALEEQEQHASYSEMSFEERLGLLVDREFTKRNSNRIKRLIHQARFQNPEACVENILYSADRKLDRSLVRELASCQFIRSARNLTIFGATGAGESYLGQALGQAACRMGISTRYMQLPDFLEELRMAEEQGWEKLAKKRKLYTNVDLLLLDEWLLFKIDETDCQNLLKIIDRRVGRKSTIVMSQFNPEEWITQIPNQLAAESITDRLTAQAHTIVLESKESMRSRQQKAE